MLDGSDSGGAWGAYVTYSWALTHPANGVTVVFDDPASAAPTLTIPPLLANTELGTVKLSGILVLLQGSVVEGGGPPTKGRLRSSVQLHQRASVRYVACLIHV